MRTRVALVALALAGLLLVACGGGGDDASEAVKEAPGKTLAANSAEVALLINFTAGTTSGTVNGQGVADLQNRRAGLNLDLGSLGGALGAPRVETVLDSSGIFVKLPVTLLPASRPWLKLDLATLAATTGANFGSLGQLSSADPTQALAFLEGAASDMKKVGEESVRGASTTHYRGTLDLQKAAEEASPEARPAVQQAITALGTSKVPSDVWLDEEGRVRKLRLSIKPSSGSGSGNVEIELFGFGTPADVAVPPANQISTIAQLLGTQPR